MRMIVNYLLIDLIGDYEKIVVFCQVTNLHQNRLIENGASGIRWRIDKNYTGFRIYVCSEVDRHEILIHIPPGNFGS